MVISTILITLLCSAAAILVYYGFAKIRNAPLSKHIDADVSRHLSVKELGLIEGTIPNLNEVIIIADQIEEPTDELYHSVKENLKKGVKYIFLVSEKNYENEKNSYWKIFQAIGDTIKHNYHIENSLEIYPLNFEWDDFPFVFYRFTDSIVNKQKAYAYMGTELREGIADEYEIIYPTIAMKMLNLAFKGVTIPAYERISLEELMYDPQLTNLTQLEKTA